MHEEHSLMARPNFRVVAPRGGLQALVTAVALSFAAGAATAAILQSNSKSLGAGLYVAGSGADCQQKTHGVVDIRDPGACVDIVGPVEHVYVREGADDSEINVMGDGSIRDVLADFHVFADNAMITVSDGGFVRTAIWVKPGAANTNIAVSDTATMAGVYAEDTVARIFVDDGAIRTRVDVVDQGTVGRVEVQRGAVDTRILVTGEGSAVGSKGDGAAGPGLRVSRADQEIRVAENAYAYITVGAPATNATVVTESGGSAFIVFNGGQGTTCNGDSVPNRATNRYCPTA
mmetsp:Transcript_7955/g.24930  ORF Transcript_7955/g.24930 Transcript_7955/m.24930 type:complete len:289 (+) Transcript_7955:206-1072(+)